MIKKTIQEVETTHCVDLVSYIVLKSDGSLISIDTKITPLFVCLFFFQKP